MRIAITDACIFIDLIDLKLLSHFFGLDLQIHTSVDVYNELYTHQQELLEAYKSVDKLFIHNISPKEWVDILNEGFPKSLSDSDKTVIFLAKKLSAIVISSDKTVRNYSKQNAIPYHGMLWIFDKLIEENLINKNTAIARIKQLVLKNIVYQNNIELTNEIDKRIKVWSN